MLGVISSLPPLPLDDVLQATLEVRFWYLVVPCLLVAHLFWAACLPGLYMVLAPCFIFFPFLGWFPFLKFGRFSSIDVHSLGLYPNLAKSSSSHGWWRLWLHHKIDHMLHGRWTALHSQANICFLCMRAGSRRPCVCPRLQIVSFA
jgi:hypothetical protein